MRTREPGRLGPMGRPQRTMQGLRSGMATPSEPTRSSASRWNRSWLSAAALVLLLGQNWPAAGAVSAGGDILEPQPLAVMGVGEAQAVAGGPAGGSVGISRGPRNPFAPSARLMQLKDQPNAAATLAAQSDFTPVKQVGKMPKMRLRGHLQGRDGEVVALLELVGGDVYIVREGDTVGLHDFGIDSVIRVQKISRLHLVVESGSLNQKFIVR